MIQPYFRRRHQRTRPAVAGFARDRNLLLSFPPAPACKYVFACSHAPSRRRSSKLRSPRQSAAIGVHIWRGNISAWRWHIPTTCMWPAISSRISPLSNLRCGRPEDWQALPTGAMRAPSISTAMRCLQSASVAVLKRMSVKTDPGRSPHHYDITMRSVPTSSANRAKSQRPSRFAVISWQSSRSAYLGNLRRGSDIVRLRHADQYALECMLSTLTKLYNLELFRCLHRATNRDDYSNRALQLIIQNGAKIACHPSLEQTAYISVLNSSDRPEQ